MNNVYGNKNKISSTRLIKHAKIGFCYQFYAFHIPPKKYEVIPQKDSSSSESFLCDYNNNPSKKFFESIRIKMSDLQSEPSQDKASEVTSQSRFSIHDPISYYIPKLFTIKKHKIQQKQNSAFNREKISSRKTRVCIDRYFSGLCFFIER